MRTKLAFDFKKRQNNNLISFSHEKYKTPHSMSKCNSGDLGRYFVAKAFSGFISKIIA